MCSVMFSGLVFSILEMCRGLVVLARRPPEVKKYQKTKISKIKISKIKKYENLKNYKNPWYNIPVLMTVGELAQ